MSRYSLKQFLNEDASRETGNLRLGSVESLVSGMKKSSCLLQESVDSPITPKGTGWDHLTNPDRLRRIFEIDNQCARRIFVNDVLNLADESMHNVTIYIEGNRIIVETYTADLNEITNMDFEYAKDIDEMYVDAMFSCSNSDLGKTNELW